MSDEHLGVGDSPAIDTGLACLVMLARFHNTAASPEQLAHEFAPHGETFNTSEILLAAKKLGLKAKSTRSKLDRLDHVPLPAIARSIEGQFFIIARIDDGKALIHEAPVHPAPRIIQWTIMAFAVLALIWACVGEVDVVATASGKIVPSGKSKIIQPSEVAVVKAIHVYDGQAVKAGELLVELDSEITGADVQRLKSDLLAAQVDSARAGALLESIEHNRPPASLAERISQALPQQQASAQTWLQGQYLELRSALEQSDAEIAQRVAEIQAAQAWVGKLQESLPITRQLAADYKRLLDKAIIGKHAFLEREQRRMDQERELAIQQARVIELPPRQDSCRVS